MEPYLAEIRMFAGTFAPRGWAFCFGQLLAIASNNALFSLIGTLYGGDGRTTVGLPDLRGRFPLGWSQGPGLPPYEIGQVGGAYQHTLLINELPSHQHSASFAPGASSLPGTSATPANNVPAVSSTRDSQYAATANTTMAAQSFTTGAAGGSQPFETMPPYVGINFIIALEGIYPPRD